MSLDKYIPSKGRPQPPPATPNDDARHRSGAEADARAVHEDDLDIASDAVADESGAEAEADTEAEVEAEAEAEEAGPRTEGAEAIGEEVIIGKTAFTAETPDETGTCYLLSVSYSGPRRKALAKLYDPRRKRIVFWYDNTGHLPYCLTDLSLKEVLSEEEIVSHSGFAEEATEEVEKRDLLHDRVIRVTKVAAKDPLSIGGRTNSIREVLRREGTSWEDRIQYRDSYIFDRGLIPGYTYRIKGGDLVREDYRVEEAPIRERFRKARAEFLKELLEWFPLFVSPVPDFRRVAIDIEVAAEALDRVPDPRSARNQVICVSLMGSDGVKKALLLKREGVTEGERPAEMEDGLELEYYDDEITLLKEVFRYIADYPIVCTFNGDNFDLPYLWRRGQVVGIPKEEIPIMMGRDSAMLPVGVHLDLYRFFFNHAIRIYAFGNSYREVTLDAVSSAVLGISKIPIDKNVSELSYLQLANYCARDSYLTLRLTTENSNVVMHLITLFMRISRLSMEDVTRQGISGWIRNLFYAIHRYRNCLIPRQEDIAAMKNVSYTKAIIKGKKYMGAMVIVPKPGAYFDVVVVDFASLYPSIIARWNLSYETVRCPHPEDRDNLIPNTNHWVCRKVDGMMSTVVGLMKDVRVKWFKVKSKDPSLSEEERHWYRVVQQALKVFLNASYGVFGADIFPLYCLPLAESTTAIGRYIITQTIDKAKAAGIDVIYGDTDSLFLRRPAKEQIAELLSWAEADLGIDLEIDKRYTYVTFSGRKKNYLGVMDNGIVDIKGLMGKKRNTPVFIKTAFNEMIQVLRDVRNPDDFVKAKAKIREIVQNCYANLRNRRYSLEDLTFKVMLSRSLRGYAKTTPQHVKAAKQLEAKGKEVKPGDIISYVKVEGPLGVKPVQLARIDEVDVAKYVGHIETTFGQVLEALGIEFDEIMGVRRLESFSGRS